MYHLSILISHIFFPWNLLKQVLMVNSLKKFPKLQFFSKQSYHKGSERRCNHDISDGRTKHKNIQPTSQEVDMV